MSKQFFQNNYHVGDKVFAKKNPQEALIIRRYVDQIYYCKILNKPKEKELVFYEREFIENNDLISSNYEKRKTVK